MEYYIIFTFIHEPKSCVKIPGDATCDSYYIIQYLRSYFKQYYTVFIKLVPALKWTPRTYRISIKYWPLIINEEELRYLHLSMKR